MLDNILDYLRIALYALFAVVGFLLYQAWVHDHPKPIVPTNQVQTTATPTNRYIPEVAQTSTATHSSTTQPMPNVAPASKVALINVKTDLFTATIDPRGGAIVSVKLLKYPESLGSPIPFLLLNDNEKSRYIAESGLLSKQGPDTTDEQAIYTADKTDYALAAEDKELVVTLNWNKAGINVTKRLTFVRDSYEIKVAYTIQNQSKSSWQGNLYTQLVRTDTPPASSEGLVNLATYFGAAISTQNKPYQKVSFKEMREKEINLNSKDGWAAMIQHYFISAWIPPKGAESNYYSKVLPGGLYTIGMMGSPLVAPAGSTISTETKLYTGPAIADRLEQTAPGLKLTIDYGWFWFISDILFWIMEKIHEVVGNWGWSILILTIIIKVVFYPLSAKSYRSMSGLKKLQPKIEALKERHGNDKQKMTQATLELYRQEKVNPMSGCLPMLIQIPVFIALYWVLVESVELRQAPFILWIHDLSQRDPYYVLPVLMGLSMWLQQRLNPAPPDPVQAKVMMLMPIIFTVMFANFPAGLMLYWFMNNTLSFLQQWQIMHHINKEANRPSSKQVVKVKG